jgi:hypothetical protein
MFPKLWRVPILIAHFATGILTSALQLSMKISFFPDTACVSTQPM